jgi:hypothetical protein
LPAQVKLHIRSLHRDNAWVQYPRRIVRERVYGAARAHPDKRRSVPEILRWIRRINLRASRQSLRRNKPVHSDLGLLETTERGTALSACLRVRQLQEGFALTGGDAALVRSLTPG